MKLSSVICFVYLERIPLAIIWTSLNELPTFYCERTDRFVIYIKLLFFMYQL